MLRVAENFQKSNLTVRKRGMAGSCQFRLRLSTDGRPADILAPSPPALLRGSRRIRRRIFSTVHFCVVPCGLTAHPGLFAFFGHCLLSYCFIANCWDHRQCWSDIPAPSPPLLSEGGGGSEGERGFSPLCTFVWIHVDWLQACSVISPTCVVIFLYCQLLGSPTMQCGANILAPPRSSQREDEDQKEREGESFLHCAFSTEFSFCLHIQACLHFWLLFVVILLYRQLF